MYINVYSKIVNKLMNNVCTYLQEIVDGSKREINDSTLT